MKGPVAVVVSSLALVAACRTQPPAGHVADVVLAEVAVPAPASISRARLRRRFVDRQQVQGGGGHGGVFGSAGRSVAARYEWVVEADGAAAGSRVIESRLSQDAGPLLAGDAARVRLAAAPDGHALAFSLDAGASWRALALDLGRRWVEFADVPRPSGPSWAGAPSSRDLLVDALRAGTARAPSVYRDVVVSEHLESALDRVCETPDDEALALAAAAAFTVQVNPMSVSYPNLALPGAACLQRAARRLPALRRALRDAVREGAGRRREMAAWVLSDGATAEDQDALARALVEPAAAGADVPAEGHTRLFVTWALAASIAGRGAVTAAAVEALASVATGPAPVPYASWNLVQVHAARGLAAAASDEGARRALGAIARGACAHPMGAVSLTFRVVFEQSLEANGHELPCWARAALGAGDAGGAPDSGERAWGRPRAQIPEHQSAEDQVRRCRGVVHITPTSARRRSNTAAFERLRSRAFRGS